MRQSAFRGNWSPNKRPYVTLTPDAFVTIQGETSVIGCGECRRQININDYVTSLSTEASIDSAPGSATINLSIPDTDVNDFFVDGQLVIIPMMEIEIYAKGYYLIGGFPQYYRIFWGVVSSVSKSWSGGTTSVSISCKDILRWWELTNVTINPAFLESFGGSAGGYQLWQNQFAGMNPITIIIKLAREAMGDFSLTQGSFTSFLPEKGPEGQVIASYAKDVMAYWQLKFSNIWNSLVIYGSSGEMYTFTGDGETVSPVNLSAAIFNNEEKLAGNNQATSVFKIQPGEVTPFKMELNRAGDVEFFQTEQQSKLSIAQTCRDQAGWEFYCDTTGDIVFKPPFYNLNVIPNKPVSWIQNYEIIDDSVTDSEGEVFTHITSSGNAFGGVMDWGLNDEITTPRTGVIDFHLLRRYGWRRLDYQCEWAGNPKKLFYWLTDYLDRINAKRQNGSVTIPMRPELRMGFPIWFPRYDSFFYIQGISHQYSQGGQATTTLTLIAKRSKFIAPNNIGSIKKSSNTRTETVRDYKVPWKPGEPKKPPAWVPVQTPTYEISFPDRLGNTAGLSNEETMGKPVVVRDPKTGKLLGFPNVVMVYRSTVQGTVLSKILEEQGSKKAKDPPNQDKKKQDLGSQWTYNYTVAQTFSRLKGDERARTISKLRAHRYEAGMTNGGAYDYAHDESRAFQEITLIPTDSIVWNAGGENPDSPSFPADKVVSFSNEKDKATAQKNLVDKQTKVVKESKDAVNAQVKVVAKIDKELAAMLKKQPVVPKKVTKSPPTPTETSGSTTVTATEPPEITAKRAELQTAKDKLKNLQDELTKQEVYLTEVKANQGNIRVLANLNVLVRPVSDEFGFEVIGHNKYGRGVFIDRGKLQLKTFTAGASDTGIINQINVQFAPTGGILTDPGIVGSNNGSSMNFAASFESMQPDDYVTGASFSGSNNRDDIKGFNFTSQETYTNLINANTGKSLYIEADATRKSKTLGELKPTMEIGGLNGLSDCACGLGKANWLSILPTNMVNTILKSTSFADVKPQPVVNSFGEPLISKDPETQSTSLSIEREKANIAIEQLFPGQHLQTDFSGKDAIIGNVTTGGFFNALSEYLKQLTSDSYEQNALREARATASDKVVTRTLFDAPEVTNTLGDPKDPLFNRAALGDPAAISALQNQVANSNFGMTQVAVDNYKTAWADGKEKIQKSYETFGNYDSGAVFEVTTDDPAKEKAEVDQLASNQAAVRSLEQATTGKSPPQVPSSKQVQPNIPSPNLASLIINPSTNSAKNQSLVDQKLAQDVSNTGKTPGQVSIQPPTKPTPKKPGVP